MEQKIRGFRKEAKTKVQIQEEEEREEGRVGGAPKTETETLGFTGYPYMLHSTQFYSLRLLCQLLRVNVQIPRLKTVPPSKHPKQHRLFSFYFHISVNQIDFYFNTFGFYGQYLPVICQFNISKRRLIWIMEKSITG